MCEKLWFLKPFNQSIFLKSCTISPKDPTILMKRKWKKLEYFKKNPFNVLKSWYRMLWMKEERIQSEFEFNNYSFLTETLSISRPTALHHKDWFELVSYYGRSNGVNECESCAVRSALIKSSKNESRGFLNWSVGHRCNIALLKTQSTTS